MDEPATAKAKLQIEMLMRERRKIAPGEADNFTVRDMKEIADTLESVTGTLRPFSPRWPPSASSWAGLGS